MSLSGTHTGRVFNNANRWVLSAMLALPCAAAIYLLDRQITVALVPDRLADLTLAGPLFAILGNTRDLMTAALGALAAWLTTYGSSRGRRQNDEAQLE